MRQCINPDCPAFAEGRAFNPDDVICPRCGQPLADVSDADVLPAARPARSPMGQATALIIALLTFVGVLGIVFVLAGLTNGFGAVVPGVATTPVVPAPATAAAAADATHTAVALLVSNTPIPIIILPTPAGSIGGTTNPPAAPTATALPGSTQGGSGPVPAVISGISASRLCQRISTTETCDPVTAYTSRDDFNVAVQAGFGPGGASSVRVDWYDPNGRLLQSSTPVSPKRTGTYWVAFTLKQSVPWAPGVYRADVYLDSTRAQQIDIPVIP